jgi:hypothetical protein
MIGVCELYFKKHEGYREHLIRDMREELINQCAELYSNVVQVHQAARITAPVLLYLTIGVI